MCIRDRKYIAAHEPKMMDDLFSLIRIPSISTDGLWYCRHDGSHHGALLHEYTGEWQELPPLPEKDAYRVYFDVSNAADWRCV